MYKRQLHEWCQKKYGSTPIYIEIDQKGPDHEKVYVLEVYIDEKAIAIGTGSNKKEASNDAAGKAVQTLNIKPLKTRSSPKKKNINNISFFFLYRRGSTKPQYTEVVVLFFLFT